MKHSWLLKCFLLLILAMGAWHYPSPIFNFLYRPADKNSLQTEMITIKGVALTMPFRILIPGPLDEEIYKQCEHAIWHSFHQIDFIFNRWNPKSQISLFNSSSHTGLVNISKDLGELLTLAGKVWNLSDGRYDPTVLPAIQLWRHYLQKGVCPPISEQEALLHTTGWRYIKLKSPRKIKKTHPNIQIDLSSIAKGHGVDLIVEQIQQLGVKHLFVEWGGELRVIGGHPDQRPWVVGVKPPKNAPTSLAAKLRLYQGAVATSGHDEQFWLAQDDAGQIQAFSHIINPCTRSPLIISQQQIVSCTVIAPTCALADALATTGLLFEDTMSAKKWAEKVCQEWPKIQIFFFTKDQNMIKVGENCSNFSIALL